MVGPPGKSHWGIPPHTPPSPKKKSHPPPKTNQSPSTMTTSKTKFIPPSQVNLPNPKPPNHHLTKPPNHQVPTHLTHQTPKVSSKVGWFVDGFGISLPNPSLGTGRRPLEWLDHWSGSGLARADGTRRACLECILCYLHFRGILGFFCKTWK